MSYEAVDIFVKEKTPPQDPISGVVVKVFSENGSLVYGQATTDADGKASFLLPNATYQLRFYKQQVSFAQPKLITVLEAPVAPQTNSFDVLGESFVPPVSTDPRLCVASGIFKKPNGAPAPNVDMHFITKFDPVLLDGAAVLTERMSTRTDANGYAQISLIRFAQYDVTIEGIEDYLRMISVPDKPSTNLPDLLFPVVAQITFSPEGPYALAVNDEITITPTVITSDGRVLDGTALEDVSWRVGDVDVAALSATATTLVLRGVGAGTTTLIAERSDTTIIRIPDTPIVGVPVDITIT